MLTHDHDWDVASEPSVDCEHLHHVVLRQLIRHVWILNQSFDAQNVANFGQLRFSPFLLKRLIERNPILYEALVKSCRHDLPNQNLVRSLVHEVDGPVSCLENEAEEGHRVAVLVEEDVGVRSVLPAVALIDLWPRKPVPLALVRNFDRPVKSD